MPVTVTAKRALRGSTRKALVNKLITDRLEIAIRKAKKLKSKESITEAISSLDRAAKKKVLHKNKAARVKSQLAKLMKPAKVTKKAGAPKKKKSSRSKSKK